MNEHIRKLLPFTILFLLIGLVYFTNIHHDISLDKLRKGQDRLIHIATTYPIFTHAAFILIYIVSVCLIIPDSTILTLIGGYIFPLPVAIIYTVVAETVGAIIFFTVFHSAFTDSLIKRERPLFSKMRKKFHHHSASYLLFLRFSHVLPFWLTNVAAAYFKVSYSTFIWTTFVGVIPLAFLLSDAGHNLHYLFDTNPHLTLGDLFTTQMKLILVALGIISLLPIIIQKFKKKKKRWTLRK